MSDSKELETIVRQTARKYEFDEDVAWQVARHESGTFHNDWKKLQNVRSSKGAVGPMQLLPSTAKELGVDPYDINQNVDGGIRYLKKLSDRYGGDVDKTLAAYNWGMGNLERYGLGKAPSETQAYIKNIRSGVGNQTKESLQDIDNYLANVGSAQTKSPFEDIDSYLKDIETDQKPPNASLVFPGSVDLPEANKQARPKAKFQPKFQQGDGIGVYRLPLEGQIISPTLDTYKQMVMKALEDRYTKEVLSAYQASSGVNLADAFTQTTAGDVLTDDYIASFMKSNPNELIFGLKADVAKSLEDSYNERYQQIPDRMKYEEGILGPGPALRMSKDFSEDSPFLSTAIERATNGWIAKDENAAVAEPNSLAAVKQLAGNMVGSLPDMGLIQAGAVIGGLAGGGAGAVGGAGAGVVPGAMVGASVGAGTAAAATDMARKAFRPLTEEEYENGASRLDMAFSNPVESYIQGVTAAATGGLPLVGDLVAQVPAAALQTAAQAPGTKAQIRLTGNDKADRFLENLTTNYATMTGGKLAGKALQKINSREPTASQSNETAVNNEAAVNRLNETVTKQELPLEATSEVPSQSLPIEQPKDSLSTLAVKAPKVVEDSRPLQQIKKIEPISQPRKRLTDLIDTQNGQAVENSKVVEDTPVVESEKQRGKASRVYTERGAAIDTEFAVVESDQLVKSNNTDLSPNPNYPKELQPRDRTRIASRAQIANLAKNLNPELLGDSSKASDGAPIVGSDLIVESGNGRSIALEQVYQEGGQKAAEYKKYLIDKAGDFGLDPATITAMNRPVLVRVRKTEVDRKGFAQDANQSSVAQMSASEQARTDSSKLSSRLLSIFEPDENGEILTSQNRREFIPAFLEQVVGPTERGQYLDSTGAITVDGINRIKRAIFARAFADSAEGTNILEKFSESPDQNVRNISTAMLKTAGRFASLKDEIGRGNRYELDISQDLTAAVSKLSSLREQAASVQDYLDQIPLFEDDLTPMQKSLLKVLDQNKRSSKNLTTILNNYLDLVEGVGDPKQQGLFGDISSPSKGQLLDNAVASVTGIKPGFAKLVDVSVETPLKVDNEKSELSSIRQDQPIENSILLSPSQARLEQTKRRLEKEFVDKFLVGKQEASAVVEILEARAETWARETGKSSADWFDSRIASIEQGARGKVPARAKGATEFLSDGRAIIRALRSADVSTLIHETGHIFRRDLLQSEAEIANKWAQSEYGEKAVSKEGRWSRSAEEGFARAFERYIYDGQAPTQQLTTVFEKLSNWMRNIYSKLRGSAVSKQVSAELKTVFDKILGKPLETPTAESSLERPSSLELLESDYNAITTKESFTEAAKLIAKDAAGAYQRAISESGGEIENALGLEFIREAESSGDYSKIHSVISGLIKRNKVGREQVVSSLATISPKSVKVYAEGLLRTLADRASDKAKQRAKANTDLMIRALDEGTDLEAASNLLFQDDYKAIPSKIRDIASQYQNKADRDRAIAAFFNQKFGIPDLDPVAADEITSLATHIQRLSREGVEPTIKQLPASVRANVEAIASLYTDSGLKSKAVKEVLAALVHKRIQQQVPSTFGRKANWLLRVSDLFRPGSWLPNTLSDLAYSSPIGLDNAANSVAAGVDYLGYKVGLFKKRSQVAPDLAQFPEFMTNLKRANKEIELGIDTTQTLENNYSIGSEAFDNKVSRFIDRWSKRGLGLSQIAGYRTAFDESIRNQIEVMKLNGAKVAEPTPNMVQLAVAEAAYKTMQDPNHISDMLKAVQEGLNKGLGKDGFGVGTLLVTYTQVPGSLLNKGIQYSPLGWISVLKQTTGLVANKLSKGKWGQELSETEQRGYVRQIGRSLLGTAVTGSGFGVTTGVGVVLSKLGLLLDSEYEEDQKKLAKLKDGQGIRGLRLNLSGLYRYATSLDDKQASLKDADLLIDPGFFQPLSFLLGFARNLDKTVYQKEKDATAWATVNSLANASVDTLTDESVIKAVVEGKNLDSFLTGLVNRATPGLIRDFRNYLDNTDRETDVSKDLGQSLTNRFKENIPLKSREMAAARTVFGQERERVTGGSTVFNTLLFGNKFSNYKEDKEAEYLTDLASKLPEKERSSLVSTSPWEIETQSGLKSLSPEQRSQYRKISGELLREAISEYRNNRHFTSLPAIEQKKKIEQTISAIRKKASQELLAEETKQLVIEDQDILSHNSKLKELQLELIQQIDKAKLNSEQRKYAIKLANSKYGKAKVAATNNKEQKQMRLERGRSLLEILDPKQDAEIIIDKAQNYHRER